MNRSMRSDSLSHSKREVQQCYEPFLHFCILSARYNSAMNRSMRQANVINLAYCSMARPRALGYWADECKHAMGLLSLTLRRLLSSMSISR